MWMCPCRTRAGDCPAGQTSFSVTLGQRLSIKYCHQSLNWRKGAFTTLENFLFLRFSSVQSLSYVWLFVTPWTAACQASLSITNSKSLLKLMSLSQGCHLTISPSVIPFSSCLQSFSASGSFQMSQFFRWPEYCSFSFSISPSNECSGLISFRMDWLDLLAVQGTLKSLLQHHSSKASILQCSAVFIVQLSHPYMTPGNLVS